MGRQTYPDCVVCLFGWLVFNNPELLLTSENIFLSVTVLLTEVHCTTNQQFDLNSIFEKYQIGKYL